MRSSVIEGDGRPADPTRAPSLLSAAQDTWFALDVEPDDALISARRIVVQADRASDELALAHALCTIAWWVGQYEADVEPAIQHLATIDRIADRHDDTPLRLRWHTAWAVVRGSLGDRSGRFDHLERMRQLAVELGDTWHELVALHDIARHFDHDDLLEATLDRSEALSEQLGEPPSHHVSLLLHSAEHLAEAGRLDRAEDRSRRALAIAEASEMRPWIGFAQCQLAEVLAAAGRADDALALVDVVAATGAIADADRLLSSARVHRSLGRSESAIDAYGAVLALPRTGRTGAQHCVQASRELAPLLAAAGEWQRAYEAQVVYEELRSRFQSEEDTRRLRGLEALHRVSVAQRVALEEQARSRHLADDIARLEGLHEELLELASRDPLTGVHNRRWIDVELPARIAASDGPTSVAILDTDHFKTINDRFGHAVGDEVLRTLTRLVAAELRSADVIARLGGEEFALVLPATELGDARRTCERVRTVVESHPWSTLVDGLHLTVSLGVAELDAATGVDAALASADAWLYAAKRDGRNCVRG